MTIKNYRQKYEVKFPQQLIPGDLIVWPGKDIARFIRYDQGGGMGSFEYGEYGILHFSNYAEECFEETIYEHYPLLVRNTTEERRV